MNAPAVVHPSKTPSRRCSKRLLVHVAGAITGLLIFGWISIALVYFAAHSSEFNPVLVASTQSPDDIHRALSAMSAAFTSLGPIESFKWQISLSFLEWTWLLEKPAITTAVSNQDWLTLYQWASSPKWLQSDAEYDFTVQNNEATFWNSFFDKPLYSHVPLPNLGDQTTEYITMERFLRAEYDEDLEEVHKLPKYRKMQGFVFRASDQLEEFQGAPKQADYKSDLVNKTISLLVLSTGARMQPSVSLSGRMIMQVSGTSEWAISAPSKLKDYQIYPFLHPLAQQSQLNFSASQPLTSSWNLAAIHINDPLHRDSGIETKIEEYDHIPALYGKLAAGRLLYIPPLWTAYQVALSTSITTEIAVEGNLDLESRLRRLVSGGDLATLIKLQQGTLTSSDDSDPEKHLKSQVESLLRVLHSVASGEMIETSLLAYQSLFASYERFHSHMVGTKHDTAHSLISSFCGGAIPENSMAISDPLPSPKSAAQRQFEAQLSGGIRKIVSEVSGAHQQVAIMIHMLETVAFVYLQDVHFLHSFLHECPSLWLSSVLQKN